MRTHWVLALAVTLGGCLCVKLPDGTRYACDQTSDCVSGEVCVERVCRVPVVDAGTGGGSATGGGNTTGGGSTSTGGGGEATGGGIGITGGGTAIDSGVPCNATTCADGCCDNDVCRRKDDAACGSGGTACITCNSGERCHQGACVCDGVSCPGGCCSPQFVGYACIPASVDSCGIDGGACTVCDPSLTDTCAGDGTCKCGTNDFCKGGRTCNAGQCTCATGCWNGSSCVPGDSGLACGATGTTCSVCGVGFNCVNNACVCPGCIDSNGQCRAGSQDGACGAASSDCVDCTAMVGGTWACCASGGYHCEMSGSCP